MTRTIRPTAVLAALLMVSAVACSDDADDGVEAQEPSQTTVAGNSDEAEPTPEPTAVPEEPTATPEPEPTVTVRVPTDVVDPGEAGKGILYPLSNAPLPDGWVEQEFVYGGTATGYEPLGDLTPDGTWDSIEAGEADYRTRLIVRRPPAEAFSGVVLVEWFNVTSGADTSPDWGFVAEEIGRSGHVYIGVSAQAVGVNGTDGDFIGGGLIDTSGLIARDPARYGDLVHPGDAYSFDIFTQAGALAAGLGDVDVLGGLEPTHVIAMGESQSAAFMTTYVNAVHPLVGLYDGFLVHSRGAFGPTPTGERLTDEEAAVQLRTDGDTPVFIYEAETDLVALNYAAARQPDSEFVRVWESAGTAHADAYTLAQAIGVPRSPDLGAVIGCPSGVNDGPHHETLQAGLHHLVAWVVDGVSPPPAPDLEIVDGAIVRDELGIALGGIRTPPVDVPLRVLSGDPGPDGGACFLFGTTTDLPPETIAELYVDQADFEAKLRASADAAVKAGWLLPVDADQMVVEEIARYEALTS